MQHWQNRTLDTLSPIGSFRPQKEIRVCPAYTRFVKVLQTNPLSQDTFSGSQAL